VNLIAGLEFRAARRAVDFLAHAVADDPDAALAAAFAPDSSNTLSDRLPTVLRSEPYRIFFYSLTRQNHHTFMASETSATRNSGFLRYPRSGVEVSTGWNLEGIEPLIETHIPQSLEVWDDFFEY